jgi:predicted O-methyltransferase YrrM
MNLFHAFKYLEYKLTARHGKGFGIHSPFAFDLVSRVFRNKTPHEVVFTVETIRRSLIRCRSIININDLGAGPSGSRSNRRKVSEIARHSTVPEKYGKLLYAFAAEYGKPSVIELGTSLGISTMYMSMSISSRILTVEGCPETAAIANENFRKAGLKNITLYTGSFDSVLPQLLEKEKPGLVFIDGNHRKEPVLKYFEMIAEADSEKTVVVIDDIYLSREMAEAWDLIKQHKNVSVTVDIYRMGLVFFRRGITNNNYKISY